MLIMKTRLATALPVVASDGVNDAVEQSVTLTVNNLDEVAPSIDSGDTGTSVDENSGADQVVYTASATDTDANVEGITFSLVDDTLGFSIDAESGVVTTNADFAADYEAENGVSQSFTVVAIDAAGNESDAQQVTVSVNNIDESAPTVTSADSVSIDENSTAGSVIYTATADDSLDTSAGVTFSLAAGSDAALSIDPDSGEVILAVTPDFEVQSQYSFAVVATDAADNASEAQSVTLNINNLDEVAPTIRSGGSIILDENSGAEQVIYTVTADDSADISGGVTYSLDDNTIYPATDGDSGSAESIVTIPELAAATQHVYVSESTKSEDGSQETVVVTYNADAGNTGLGLRIHFDSSAVSVASLDNVLAGTVFANSTPTADTDDKDNDASTDSYIDMAWASLFGGWPGTTPANLATVTFDILEGASGSAAINFSSSSNASGFTFAPENHALALSAETAPVESQLDIDSQTGFVTLNVDPDYEAVSSYSFDIFATDAEGNKSEARAVTLGINNFDDTAPLITSGADADINENSGAGQIVYTATASDNADTSDGFTFSLADETLGFSIDAESGVVTTNEDFAADFEDAQSQSFTVVATDVAANTSEQVVTVAVNNLDEIAPTITSVVSDASSVDENSGADQVVYKATASDDADTSNGFSFSLADVSLGFSIDAVSGEVTTNADFSADFESAESQSFTVVATDVAGNASEQVVTIAINNLDDTSPLITSNALDNVDENIAEPHVIYTATTDDETLDVSSGGISYSIDPILFHEYQAGAIKIVQNEDSGLFELYLNEDIHNDTSPLESIGFTLNYQYHEVEMDTSNVVLNPNVTLAAISPSELGVFKVTELWFPDGFYSASNPIATFDFNYKGSVGLAQFEISDIELTALPVDEFNAGSVIYIATADDSLDTDAGVTFALTDDSDSALSIDAATGDGNTSF
jgi:hypothetical protein